MRSVKVHGLNLLPLQRQHASLQHQSSRVRVSSALLLLTVETLLLL